jgi:hypothetical protein
VRSFIEATISVPRGLSSQRDANDILLPSASPSVTETPAISLNIDSDGEVRFNFLFRSARLRIDAPGVTVVRLAWDRFSGRLIATRVSDLMAADN